MSADDQDTQAVPKNQAPVTVFDDPERFNVKHPLQNRWTLWFDAPLKRSTAQDWNQNLRQVVTFDSVEEFWGVYNNILPASKIPLQGNYHIFKEGIKPAWEDPENAKGGKWVLVVPKSNRIAQGLDQQWLYTPIRYFNQHPIELIGFYGRILACIGEHFTHGDEICGAVVSVRRQHNRISIWTKNADDEDKVMSIGYEFKAIFSSGPKLSYTAHADATKKSSVNSDKYNV